MFDGREPLYVQIADQIRQDVLSGALEAEEQVMSTTQYATTFRINPATAAKAFAELVDEGVLYKRRGVGMFVAPGAREKLRAERRDTFFADVVDPVLEQARLLGIDVDEVVARLRERAATAAQPTTDTPQAGAR
ncbi:MULTISPECIES: GntR family transcriptional regulator [Cellulomonas]|uniref:GntR family transcriptional regulator n=2 Tax=Cellulomonas TaxID=1707 RepID=A0A401UX21_9CELL|nr:MULTISPECIES: GntR family transcriptional regulator [Cellulomonas]NKY40167.1 GntR family transcriptional regulator [Cellulomonas septica]GCD19140.1 GntR family transcriptional regulator [Cellulomonas algicola]